MCRGFGGIGLLMFKLWNSGICKCLLKGNIKDNRPLSLLWLCLPATMCHIRVWGLGGEEKIHLKFSSLKKKKNPNVFNQLESSVDLWNRLGLTGYWLLIKQYLALSDEQQWKKVWAPCQTRAIEDGWWVKCGGLSGSVGAQSSRRTCQLLVRLVKGRTPAPDGWGSIDAS